eukprot:gene9067-10035_t
MNKGVINSRRSRESLYSRSAPKKREAAKPHDEERQARSCKSEIRPSRPSTSSATGSKHAIDSSLSNDESADNEDDTSILQSGSLEAGNPAKVYSIDYSAKKFKEINGVEKYSNCRCLDLSCNQIKVIRNLDKNLEICELKLYSNEISSLQGLERLKKIQNLQLQHNKIQEIGNGLNNLSNLKILRLSHNQLSNIDLKEIKCCSVLTHLDLSNNCLKRLDFLRALPWLEEFCAAFNQLESCPDASLCKKVGNSDVCFIGTAEICHMVIESFLQEVDFSNNCLSSLNGLKNLPKLTILNVSCNNFKDLRSLSSSRSLQQIDISGNTLTDLQHIAQQFPNLEALSVANNKISSPKQLEILSCLKGLKELSLDGNPIKKQVEAESNWNKKLHDTLPQLEFLDGIYLIRPKSRSGEQRPMRPMTASQGVSTRLIQAQMNVIDHEVEFYKDVINSKFNNVKELLLALPDRSKTTDDKTEKQKEDVLSIQTRPMTSGSMKRPATRCGSRARIQEALAFASTHNDEVKEI